MQTLIWLAIGVIVWLTAIEWPELPWYGRVLLLACVFGLGMAAELDRMHRGR